MAEIHEVEPVGPEPPGPRSRRRRAPGDLRGPGAQGGGTHSLLHQSTVPMTVFAQDPEVVAGGRALTTTIPVPAGRLQQGPTSHRFQVVDVGAGAVRAELPVRLNAEGDPWHFADRWAGAGPDVSGGMAEDRDFRAQNVFAIASHTLALFERHLGRRVPWRSGWPHLYLVPKGTLGANAAYTPDRQAVVFGWLPALGTAPAVYSCLSYDVIAHEVTHAILDGLRPRYVEPGLPDQLAFHEALADLVALLSVFELDGVAQQLLDGAGQGRIVFPSDRDAARIKDPDARARARMTGREEQLKRSALTGLAEELGRARALRDGQPDAGPGTMPLRRSITLPPGTAWQTDPAYAEPHRRAEVLVAAVMQTLAGMWSSRIEPLDPTGGLDAARVAEEGVRAAQHLLGMLLRAVDYLPPVELEFADVVDSIVTADRRLNPDDEFDYRGTLLRTFAAFGIRPPPHRILDEDGQAAPSPAGHTTASSPYPSDPDAPVDRIRYEHLNFASLRTSPEEVFAFIWNNAGALDIDVRLATRVDRVLTTTRVGPDGLIVTEILADYTQWVRTSADRLPAGMTRPAGMEEDARVELWGGGVLVFDQFGRFRLHQRKPVLDVARQQRRLDDLFARDLHDSDGGFGTSDGVNPDERFALLHAVRSEDSW